MSCKIDLSSWVAEKIKENPYKFGGDEGNSSIILEYLRVISSDVKIENLSYKIISNSVSVSRKRNQFLKDYPEYDFREINREEI